MVKILLVEDNSDLNLTVCRHLNLNNYMAFGCTNALDAYDILYDNKIDLIISDIMMPDVDGFEFAKNVREEKKFSSKGELIEELNNNKEFGMKFFKLK